MQNDTVFSVLNNLIETCKDGEIGFRTAADGLTDPALQAKFREYASERGDFARALQAEVRALGGDPETSGSVSGSLHRGWIDIKSVVTGKSNHAILAEAERGEDVAKAAYEAALKEELPASAASLVLPQASRVRAVHDAVRDARDREKVTTH
jgi:uncharacterized protein (TIGR02284 family)